MNDKEREKDFLREYGELCKKYGLCISTHDPLQLFVFRESDPEDIDWDVQRLIRNIDEG